VLAARPEVILGGGSVGGEQEFAGWWRASAVPALRELPLRYIDPDLIQRQTPRIVAGAKAVCRALDEVRKRRDAAKTR
jgi:iron complex transport system substrate-binding protein